MLFSNKDKALTTNLY